MFIVVYIAIPTINTEITQPIPINERPHSIKHICDIYTRKNRLFKIEIVNTDH